MLAIRRSVLEQRSATEKWRLALQRNDKRAVDIIF